MIPISKPTILGNEKKYLNQCIDTEWISSAGKFIPQFEEMNADQYQKKYGVAVSNGTVALHLALVALNIGPGDEVIIPDLTFAATINAVLYTGATPVISDVELDTWTISIDSCETLVNSKTKAIIPVHLYGQPADMAKVMAFAEKHDLLVIEDCAEAHGANYKGEPVGSFGDISCFSFYGNKIITTGEGGVCLTNDQKLYERMRILRDHGMSPSRKFLHEVIGYNYRMTNMQAAVGVAQMEQFEGNIRSRKRIRDNYDKYLGENPFINLQKSHPDRDRVTWLYSILIDIEKSKMGVEKIRNALLEHEIDSRPFFTPFSQMDIYKKYGTTSTDNSQSIARRGLNLPTFVGLERDQIEFICSNLAQIING